MKIILVEPNDNCREAMKIAIEHSARVLGKECKVAETADFSEAQKAVAENADTDIVFIAYDHPTGLGGVAGQAIKGAHPDIKVVLMSATAYESDVERLGLDGFWPKDQFYARFKLFLATKKSGKRRAPKRKFGRLFYPVICFGGLLWVFAQKPKKGYILRMQNKESLEHKRHSLAHLLAAAVLELYPDAKPTIGPAMDNGFYYDFDFAASADKRGTDADKRGISEKDLPKIEQRMRELVKSWKTFEGKEVSEKEARTHFKGNQYKLELIDDLAKEKQKITFYTCGDFTDLCRGGHIENPSKDIAPSSWKLDRVAGAYWRGDEKNAMLTRIYGLAFDTKEELEAYEKQLEESKKRDHKKLGPELDLFTFSELVGSGLPLWTPKGTLVRDLLEGFVWELRSPHGYERVDIPHITKKELYEKSGHWEKFKNELFRVQTREGHEFVMKPMNCPHHTQIYARKLWSYRELPQRYANTTKVYRDEQSGELAGLSRVRAITQDDAHVFCRRNQAKEEMAKVWDIISAFYTAFGFTLSTRLSLHDPKNMKVYLGTEEVWQKSEQELRELVKERGATTTETIGEAAFYGPKIDFMGKDSLGREWQVATIQLDMNMPERFDLVCVNEKGEKERIVMIHAAIMGSIERFLSVLIEHYAGAFPLWLSPVQAVVLPVSVKHESAAREALAALKQAGIRAELSDPNESLGKRVREVKMQKVPYWLVIGDKDVAANVATFESRAEQFGQLAVSAITQKLLKQIAKKS